MLFVGFCLKFKFTYRASKQEPIGKRVHEYEWIPNRASPPLWTPVGAAGGGFWISFIFTRLRSHWLSVARSVCKFEIRNQNAPLLEWDFEDKGDKSPYGKEGDLLHDLWNGTRCHQGFHKFERTCTGCEKDAFVSTYIHMIKLNFPNNTFTNYAKKTYNGMESSVWIR